MEKSKNQRSMTVTLLIVAGIIVAVTTAVGVVTGMAAARQLTRKPAE